MAEEDDDAFTFGDFDSALPPKAAILWPDFSSRPNSKPSSDPFPFGSDPGHNPMAIHPNFNDSNRNSLNGWFNPNPPLQNGKLGLQSDLNNVGFDNFDDLFGKLYVHDHQIESPDLMIVDGSGFNSKEEDDWEFKGADFGNGFTDLENQSLEQVVEVNQQKQAGQGSSFSAGLKQSSGSTMPQYIDLFALPAHNGHVHRPSEMNPAFDLNSTMFNSNGFTPSLFPDSKEINNGNGISANLVNEDDDFDDFGDFVDASQQVQPDEQERVVSQMMTTEEWSDKKPIEDKQLKQENNGGALPLSLFSDLTEEEEPNDGLEYQDNIIQKPVSYPGKGFSNQVPGVSIHDLISNLYSQAQQTSSVDPSDKKPADNGMHSLPEKMDLMQSDDDDDWDDNSWEFKDASSELGVQEQSSSHTPGDVFHKPSETSSNLGSSDDYSVYACTWSKLIYVCNDELKHGALIWKRATEKNLEHQILRDHRGQQYVQALGEIYKVVQLLGLSAKVYKPWMFLSESTKFLESVDECHRLWLTSGLEQALQDMSDIVKFGCCEPAKALISSIKNISYIDVVAVHDLVFIQQRSRCRLSLLPLEMLADLKTVLWNEEPYFLNLANLWANLISIHPPELPHSPTTQENGHPK